MAYVLGAFALFGFISGLAELTTTPIRMCIHTLANVPLATLFSIHNNGQILGTWIFDKTSG